MQKIKVGVVGLGYWGPNYVRNFHKHPQVDTVYCCDFFKFLLPQVREQRAFAALTWSNEDLDVIALVMGKLLL